MCYYLLFQHVSSFLFLVSVQLHQAEISDIVYFYYVVLTDGVPPLVVHW